MLPLAFLKSTVRRVSRGQSLVEFALVLPLLIVILVMAIDFGRVYFGWVGLQNVARIGANFAAQYAGQTDWDDPADAHRVQYEDQIAADSAAINCELPAADDMLPDFPEGTAPGNDAVVSLTCDFSLLTPVLAPLFGGSTITMSAESTFPIRSGVFAGPGGVPPTPPPPTCRTVPDLDDLTVADARLAWTDAGFIGTFFPIFGQDAEIVIDQATNPTAAIGECVSETTTVTIDSDPVATVCAAGEAIVPNLVGIKLQNAFATWDATDFTGTFLPAVTNANKNQLTASQTTNPASSPGDCRPFAMTMTLILGAPPPPPNCTVPNFIGSSSIGAQSTWSAAGFTTTVTFRKPGQLPYVINEQTLVSDGLVACNADIQLGPG